MNTQKAKKQEAWHRENPVADFIPYSVQINETTVKTTGGHYLQVIKLNGVAHEAADPENIIIWKNQINILLRNIASPRVCLWTNTVRREENSYPCGDYIGLLDKALNDKYRAHLAQKKMMVNELYLTIIYRPAASQALGFFSRMEKNPAVLNQQQDEAIEKLNELVSVVTGTSGSCIRKF
jgi:type IV secretion system protein VirB4